MTRCDVRVPGMIDQLPIVEREIALRLTEVFNAASHELYLVGGAVRDLLLGQHLVDLDFATSATPDVTRQIAAQAEPSGTYDIGEAFGTIGLIFRFPADEKTIHVEITTYRSEVYPTADRKPQVTHGVDLVEDLARRDFTINAMALQARDACLVDPWNGIGDLQNRRIVAVGDAVERFNEDPLRILRAARFAAQLDFEIDEATQAAMLATGPQLARISRERVTAELNALLVGTAVRRGLEVLDTADLYRHILPELVPAVEDDQQKVGARHKDIWDHTLQVVGKTPARLAVRWAALLHDAAKPQTRSIDAQGEVHFFGHEYVGAEIARRTLRRLKQDKALTERVVRLVALHQRGSGYDESWTDAAVRRLALDAEDTWDDLLDLAAADVTSQRSAKQAAARARVNGLREHFERLQEEAALDQLQSPLDGDVLMAMFDLPPGIWIKYVKERLRDLVIEGDLATDDTETAETLTRGWLAEPEGDLAAALQEAARRASRPAKGEPAVPPADA